MSKTYVILGANGQLGKALVAKYPEATAFGSEAFDIASPASYESVDWSQYDTIINAAAMTNVDGAETPEGRQLAWKINAAAVGLLANTATTHDLTLVHLSSDYVFDGTINEHLESEPFSPLSVYGQSKAAGDIAATTTPKHFILRTSWLIGEGKNFITTMNDLASRGIKPSVVYDQIGRLTFVPTLVGAIDHLLSVVPMYGVYNCTNSGDSISWAEIARIVYDKAGRSKSEVTAVTTQEYYHGKTEIAPRPLQCTLSLQKLENSGFTPVDWREGLEIYWNNIEEDA